jgi:helicase MOV-10
MEPSALVAIAGLQGPESKPSQVVISGDPKQLGPIVRSPVALAMGLGMLFYLQNLLFIILNRNVDFYAGDSFLVRLMDSIDLYQKSDGRYNSDVITKLTYNYRSHPQILKVPNNLFYDGELVVSFGVSKLSSKFNVRFEIKFLALR